MFKILIVGAYAEAYIKRCLTMLMSQECGDWEAQVVLDPVEHDKTYENAKQFECEKVHVFKNEKRMFAIPNLLKAAEMLNCSGDDILVLLDADDWFYNRKALSIVKSYYESNPDLLLTHGSWVSYPDHTTITNNYPYTEKDFEKGVRRVDWRASHLRTMKYKVWKRIQEKDLLDPRGGYFKVAWDLALMWPAIEMAGINRIKFIPEVLYVYNEETPFNDKKKHLIEQMMVTDYIARQKPYDYVETFFE